MLGVGDIGDGVAGDDLFPMLGVARGDLQAVEEHAGSFGVDVLGGEGDEDFADGELDGSAVLERRQLEGEKRARGSDDALLETGVEVAVGLAAESGRAALLSS